MAKKPAETAASGDEYTAASISVLSGLDPVRKRPGMYIGGTGSDGLHHLIWEIVDNGVDEAAAGHADLLELTLHADGSVEFFDNGRGIPVDTEPSTGRSAVELVFCELHAGGKFGGSGYATAGGLHGVGAAVVNALSSRLEVTVERDGYVWEMGFRQDTIGKWSSGKFVETDGIRRGKKSTRTGTTVRFWPDTDIFDPTATFNIDEIVERARQVTYLIPGTTFVITDARGDKPETVKMLSADGLADLVEHLSTGDPVSDIIRISGTGTYTERIPVQTEDGTLETRDVDREMAVDVALRWVSGWEPRQRSFVNTIVTPKGGTHVNGFERAMTRTLNNALRDTKTLRDKEDNVIKDDVAEGLISAVRVTIAEPQFEGQTKEVLGTTAASSIVYQVVADQMRDWFTRNGKRAAGKAVLGKVASAARARVAARQQRDTARRKNALESSSMPAKLADCRTKDVARSELLIIEGDSAAGSAKAARDSEFQALLPIRGKIINAAKATPKAVMDNAECAALITAVGAGSGRDFDIESARYGRIVLMSVTGDTEVLCERGDGWLDLQPIAQVIDRHIDGGCERVTKAVYTPTFDKHERTSTIANTSHLIRHHYEGDLWTIHTVFGRSVSVTTGHSVYVADLDGKVRARPGDMIVPGDRVVAPRRIAAPRFPVTELAHSNGTTTSLNAEFGELLGWYTRNGTRNGDEVRIVAHHSSGDWGIGRLTDLLAAVTNDTPHITTGPDTASVTVSDADTAELLERLAADPDKVPAVMFNADNDTVTGFLSGLIAAEQDDPSTPPMRPGLSYMSPTLTFANALTVLFARIGVFAAVGDGRHQVTVTGAELIRAAKVYSGTPAALSVTYDTPHPGLVDLSDDLVALVVTENTSEPFDGAVYDFSVPATQTFFGGNSGMLGLSNTDADVDGSHIRTLLLTFFYHWMRPILEAGRVYSAIPPLYAFTVGKDDHRYAFSDDERDQILAELQGAGKPKVSVARFKGLGEMEADELAVTTMDPASRRLRRVTLRDAEAAAAMFETLMGTAVEPRRRYIVENSERYGRSLLDV